MLKFVEKLEHYVVYALIVLMSLVVVLSAVELAHIIFQQIASPPAFLLGIEKLLDIFGYFLLVLIGVELLEILRAYLNDEAIHVEVVFMVALIAIARKVIILDLKELSSATLFGIASIILVLSIGYFLIKRIHKDSGKTI